MITSIREFIRHMTYVSFQDVLKGIAVFSFLYLIFTVPMLLFGATSDGAAKSTLGIATTRFCSHIPTSLISIVVFSAGVFILRGRRIDIRFPKYSFCINLVICFWFAIMIIVMGLDNKVVSAFFIPFWISFPAYLHFLAVSGKFRCEKLHSEANSLTYEDEQIITTTP